MSDGGVCFAKVFSYPKRLFDRCKLGMCYKGLLMSPLSEALVLAYVPKGKAEKEGALMSRGEVAATR